MIDKKTTELMDYIDNSPSVYHAVETAKNLLKNAGFNELLENSNWNITRGGKYYVTKNSSALIAFVAGEGDIKKDGFRIIGAHTDSPCFKIKPNGGIIIEQSYVKLNTECYGGAILSTWFDRPLSIAGRVILNGDSILNPTEKLININRPVLVIPNLAIHFNREANEGYKYNKQTDMLPLLGFVNSELEKDDYLLNLISDELGVDRNEILDFELFLYEYEKGNVIGLNNEFISSSRLDDLWMVYAGICALINSEKSKATKVMMALDNEEVGSTSAHGAASQFVRNCLQRIFLAQRQVNSSVNKDTEGFIISIANSIMISADLAHAVHPNYSDKHDQSNRPILGRGPVIKYSAGQKYSTTSIVASVFIRMCKENDLPYQIFVNRSDLIGGSTIGPVMSSKLAISVIDIGAPILSMHSIRELAAEADNAIIIECFKKFYEL